ncbi:MAG: recombination-associated protein RdgC [Victivallales bacterium]|nr:recombination-associated protein RdgC [Victivallales bacterium]
MPFDRGSFTVSIFQLPGQLPDNLLGLFAAKKAGKLDHVREEAVLGWTSGRTLLETEINEESAIRGGHIYLQLRKAERKIPPALFNAICQREEIAYLQANNFDLVSSKVRRDIKAQVMETHLSKMAPTVSGIPTVIDSAAKLLYVGTGSPAQLDNFIAFFFKTTGIEPFRLQPGLMLEDMFHCTECELPQLRFAEVQDDPAPGRDFLTWLWYFCECEGGRITHGQFGDFDMMIEGPLTFAFVSEARGAAETTLKKGGSPLRAAEAKAALQVGKRLRKAKFTLCRANQVWSGGIDADNFTFSSLTLPEGEEIDPASVFAERMQTLFIFQEVIREYFRKFAESIRGAAWPETEKNIRRWASERDSF